MMLLLLSAFPTKIRKSPMTAEGLVRFIKTDDTSSSRGAHSTPKSHASIISPGSIIPLLRYICLDAFFTLQPHRKRILCYASG